MRVTVLKLANLRAIEAAEFRFHPGFNLIVGVNGVGKTSMLDALRVCLSAFAKRANKLRTPVESFTVDDIRVGADALSIECGVQFGEKELRYLIHKPRESSAPREKKAGMPREQVHDTPERASFLGEAPVPVTGKEPGGRPLAVLFSTNRAVPSERAPGKNVAAGGGCGLCTGRRPASRSAATCASGWNRTAHSRRCAMASSASRAYLTRPSCRPARTDSMPERISATVREGNGD